MLPLPASLLVSSLASCTPNTARAVTAHENLKGKVVVITGADQGLGLESALALAPTGATLILLSHHMAKGEAAATNVARETGATKPLVIQVDLSSFTSVRTAATEVLRLGFGKIDVLMNNAASITGHAGQKNTTADGFDVVVQTNTLGPMLLTELLLPAVRAASPPGRVIMVSSTAASIACKWADLTPGCNPLSALPTLLRTTPPSDLNYLRQPTSLYGLTKLLNVAYAAASLQAWGLT